MNQIIEEGRRFASAADMKVSDMSANSPVGTTLAILERTLKVMSAVQARIYYAMKQEFKLLKGIIRDYTPEEYSYDPEVGDRRAKQADYDNVDVIPVVILMLQRCHKKLFSIKLLCKWLKLIHKSMIK
jgi:hypothetical protein